MEDSNNTTSYGIFRNQKLDTCYPLYFNIFKVGKNMNTYKIMVSILLQWHFPNVSNEENSARKDFSFTAFPNKDLAFLV